MKSKEGVLRHKIPLCQAVPKEGSDNAKLSKAAGSLILGALNLDQLPAQSPCTSRLNLTPGIFVKHPQGILSEMKPVILEVPTR